MLTHEPKSLIQSHKPITINRIKHDVSLRKATKIKWSSKKCLQFQVLDWKGLDDHIETDNDEDSDEEESRKPKQHQYVIRLFGVTKEGYSVCLTAHGFKPYFYISIPGNWKKSQVQLLLNTVTTQYMKYNPDPPEFTIVQKHQFRGFTNDALFKFARLEFDSQKMFNRFRDVFYEDIKILGKTRRFKLFESKMDPLLRFIHHNNINAAGWVQLAPKTYQVNQIEKISSCQIDVTAPWNHVLPFDNDKNSPILIASFDIEADSSHGDFPLAKKSFKKLASEVLVHYWNCQNTIQKYKNVDNQKEIWTSMIKYNLEEKKRRDLASKGLPVPEKVVIDPKLIELRTQEFMLQKKKEVKRLRAMLSDEIGYFYNLIAGAFDLVPKDADISYVFTKKNHKPTPQIIRSIIPEIQHICHYQQNKVKGDNELKAGVKEIVSRMENCLTFKQLEYVIHDVSRRKSLNQKHLEYKVLIKDVLVDYIDAIMCKAFHRINVKVKGDRVIQIGTVVQKFGEPDIAIRHIITLKGCEPIDDAIVVACRTEKQVLMEWQKFIMALDPDIITGYNIFGFDEKFMYDRACELGCEYQFSKLGRILEEEPKMEQKNLSSSALGDNTLDYIQMTGRVQIDLFKDVQRNYNLTSYRLDFVANTFIRGDLFKNIMDDDQIELLEEEHDVTLTTYSGSKYIEVGNVKDLMPGNFIYLTPKESADQCLDGIKYKILKIVSRNCSDGKQQDGLILDKPVPFKLLNDKKIKYCWGLAKDDVNHKDIFRLQKGSDADRRIIAVYCIQDCALLIHLINKLCVITNNLGMANVCSVPFSYIFLRGQGIKLFSLVGKECRLNNYLVPDLIKESELEAKLERVGKKRDVQRRVLEDNDMMDSGLNNFEKDSTGLYHVGFEDASQNDFIIQDNDDGYEGAIVIKPKPDIYFEPVSVTDYGSLYPSSMISENLSHDSIVFDPKYDNLPGYDYLDVTYEIKKATNTHLKNPPKVTVGYKTCRYAQFPEDQKGIIPRILMKLLKARKDTRAKIKTEPDPFKCAILDGLQLAYKITANSLYGQIGARTSPIYLKDIAASTTATGRRLLLFARHFAEKNIEGCECVYGDSIVGDEPIIYNFGDHNQIRIDSIEDIGERYKWENYSQFKPEDIDATSKMCCYPVNMNVYVKNAWMKVKRIIKHNTNKKIYRVLTHTGCVDVTEDHSLINDMGEMIVPDKCIPYETHLTHSYPIGDTEIKATKLTKLTEIVKNIPSHIISHEERKYFMCGMFYGNGSIGIYGTKYTWEINNSNLDLLTKCQHMMNSFNFPSTTFKILDTLSSSGVYKLVPSGNIQSVAVYFLKFYDNNRLKKIPNDVLNTTTDNLKQFICGYYAADGYKCENTAVKNIRLSNTGKIGTAQLYYIFKRLGYDVSINTRRDKLHIYELKCCAKLCHRNRQRLSSTMIKKVDYLRDTAPDEYVYDIETECGWFTAGIGGITLKNTDSIFVKFHDKNGSKLEGKDGLQESIDKGIQIEKTIQMYYKKPHKLEYEKTFYPFILFTKKRYVGHLYETDVNKYKQKSMGIVLKRRDNAPIVKHVYGGVIQTIMMEKDIHKSVNFLKQELKALLDGKFDVNQLVISKTLKGYYKDPDSIAHKVLADRMAERDPGNKPQVNDRIPYVYIDVPEREGMLQGDKIEHVDYVKANKLEPNYLFYITNQIMKPVSQIYELIVEKIEGYNKGSDFYDYNLLRYMDKYEGNDVKAEDAVSKIKKKEVYRLIFHPLIEQFINYKKGFKMGMTSYLEKSHQKNDTNDPNNQDDEPEEPDEHQIQGIVRKRRTNIEDVENIEFRQQKEAIDKKISKITTQQMGKITVRKTADITSFFG